MCHFQITLASVRAARKQAAEEVFGPERFPLRRLSAFRIAPFHVAGMRALMVSLIVTQPAALAVGRDCWLPL